MYPTPAVVVGTEVNGKVNWLLVAHVGIIGHDQIMLSLFKKHYSNEGVKQTGKVSVNMVNEAMLVRADYVGCVGGAKADKSDVFIYHKGEAGTPVIDESPLYVDEDCLNEKGKPDYDKLKPVLFEMPNYTYLRTGETIGKCMSFGKEYKKEEKQ